MQRRLGMMLFLVVVIATCYGQSDPSKPNAYRENQEVHVQNVEFQPIAGGSPPSALVALLQTVFHDPAVCCDKDSVLGPDVQNLNTTSLQAVSEKLKGRHVMRDGRWISVAAKYMPEVSINAAEIIQAVMQDHLLLMQWHGHLYLLKAAKYDESLYSDGTADYVIRKLVLLDPLSKEKNNEVIFDRQKDGWGNIEAILFLTAKRD